jgi:hypothetical protein
LQENGSKGIHRLPLTPIFCNETEHSSVDKVENILLRRFRGAMVPSGNAPNIGGTEYYSLSLILRKDTNFYTICQPFQRQFFYSNLRTTNLPIIPRKNALTNLLQPTDFTLAHARTITHPSPILPSERLFIYSEHIALRRAERRQQQEESPRLPPRTT